MQSPYLEYVYHVILIQEWFSVILWQDFDTELLNPWRITSCFAFRLQYLGPLCSKTSSYITGTCKAKQGELQEFPDFSRQLWGDCWFSLITK